MRATRRWAAVLAVALTAAPALAQSIDCASPPPAYRFLRFDEDFRSMRIAACRTGTLDGMKFIALGDSGAVILALGGDLRAQLVNGRYLSFGNEGGDNHNVTLQRYHVHASLSLSSQSRLFAELKSNHEQGREPGPLVVDSDRVDVHQAFIEVGSASSALLRVGRQELLYGSGRRIFPRNGPNVRGNFDAVRSVFNAADWRVDAFAFRPVAVVAGPFDDNVIDTQTFFGVYATGSLVMAPGQLDLYYLHAKRQGARYQQGVATERRHTVGARLSGRDAAWDHDHEASLQWGRFGAAGIAAWAIASETGYTWHHAAHRPRASLRVSVASGDRDATNAALQTFYSHFPRGGAVDEGFSVSAANLSHARLAVTANIAPAVDATVAVNTEWRTSRHDGVYGPSGGLIRSAGSAGARHVGDSVDALVVWTINRYAAIELQAGYFFSGRFIAQSGADRDMAFITPTLRLRF